MKWNVMLENPSLVTYLMDTKMNKISLIEYSYMYLKT